VRRQHALAVEALLAGNAHLTPFGRPVPNLTEPPYMRWFLSLDNEDGEGLCGTSDTAHWRITTHSVGWDDVMAYIVSDQVRATLLDAAPAVAGWSSERIKHETGVNPRPDRSTGVEVIDVTDVWTFMSTPA
jgi:hypothetical protein